MRIIGLLLLQGISWLPAIWLAPKIVQALLSALSDVATFQLSLAIFGGNSRSAWLALLSSLTSWFSIFIGARPFSNGFEMSLTCVALCLWYWSLDGVAQPRGQGRSITGAGVDHDHGNGAHADVAAAAAAIATRTRSKDGDDHGHNHAIAHNNGGGDLHPPLVPSPWLRSIIMSYPSLGFLVVGLLVGTATCVRPTAIGIWIFIGLLTIRRHGILLSLRIAFLHVLPGLLISIGAAIIIDSQLYGTSNATSITVPMLNFLRFNLFSGLDKLYGSYSPFWYLYNGLPAVMGVFVPFVVIGVTASVQHGQQHATRQADLALAAAGVLCILSIAAHKEHRFLAPLIPIISIYAGRGLSIVRDAMMMSVDVATGRADGGVTAILARWFARWIPSPTIRSASWYIILTIITLNIGVGVYINTMHQRGGVEVVEVLALEAHGLLLSSGGAISDNAGFGPSAVAALSAMSVHFLMPCHSTPFYSVAHYPFEMRQLDCAPSSRLGVRGPFREGICETTPTCCGSSDLPPLCESDAWSQQPLVMLRVLYGHLPQQPLACMRHKSGMPDTRADDFLSPPVSFVMEFGSDRCKASMKSMAPGADDSKQASAAPTTSTTVYNRLPSHIVMYDNDADIAEVSQWLYNNGYFVVHSAFHSYFKSDVHAIRRSDPAAVRLYEHGCWMGNLATMHTVRTAMRDARETPSPGVEAATGNFSAVASAMELTNEPVGMVAASVDTSGALEFDHDQVDAAADQAARLAAEQAAAEEAARLAAEQAAAEEAARLVAEQAAAEEAARLAAEQAAAKEATRLAAAQAAAEEAARLTAEQVAAEAAARLAAEQTAAEEAARLAAEQVAAEEAARTAAAAEQAAAPDNEAAGIVADDLHAQLQMSQQP